MISHFKEPIDIASSSFGETSAIYGGRENLRLGLENVTRQYQPQLIGVATTCLAETIGDDGGMFLREIAAETSTGEQHRSVVVHVSTPSYTGTHAEGYYAAVRAIVEQLAAGGSRGEHVNVFPAMSSPADLRHLKEILTDFALPASILPDYSETLDGPLWEDYHLIPHGGTPVKEVRAAGRAAASIEFSFTNDLQKTAAAFLSARHGVPGSRLGLPIGATQTDELFAVLSQLTGRPTPEKHRQERGRLLDSFVDAHKYLYGKRAAVFGEEDLVVAIASLLAEIGVIPALCVSGGKSGRLRHAISAVAPDLSPEIDVRDGVDFAQLDEVTAGKDIDLLIGNSKGYSLSRRLEVPLIRVGFPIHDRIGGARLLHIGYRGAQQLFDRITNAFIDEAQKKSPVGYTYM
jgi:nitrogenase molybdenum-iron protein NifN